MIYDCIADFRKTIYVGLAGAVVASLYGVVEKTIDGVVVVLIVLCGVDASLGSNRMGAAGRIAYAEDLDIIAQFSE